MTSKFLTIGVLALALAACGKDAGKKQGKPTPPPTVAADGTRSIPISVRKAGYDPDKLTVKAGEKLKLVFTRVEDTECGAQVKVADGSLVDLPLNRAVEIPLIAPPSGQIRFACGMDMMSGVLVVN
jgi:plastocyanin domain-containing protein